MRIVKAKDYNDMSRKAANIISAQVIMKPDCVLGLATGSTPIGTYAQLVEWYKKGDLDFSGITTVNLDEYKGLTKDNDQSYYYFMNHNLFSKVNVNPERTFLPDGTEPDSDKACADYNKIIADVGGIDLQLLGLGHNGHIGFNEPGTPFDSQTHKVKLTPATINANARFFTSSKDVPTEAYTMGIGSILQAKHIILLAFGEQKADAINKMVNGKVTTAVPASALQQHPNVTVILDKQAASKLA